MEEFVDDEVFNKLKTFINKKVNIYFVYNKKALGQLAVLQEVEPYDYIIADDKKYDFLTYCAAIRRIDCDNQIIYDVSEIVKKDYDVADNEELDKYIYRIYKKSVSSKLIRDREITAKQRLSKLADPKLIKKEEVIVRGKQVVDKPKDWTNFVEKNKDSDKVVDSLETAVNVMEDMKKGSTFSSSFGKQKNASKQVKLVVEKVIKEFGANKTLDSGKVNQAEKEVEKEEEKEDEEQQER
jgi:hypothetical protein